MDAVIKKYPWIISAKNVLIGLIIVGALGYFVVVSAREAKKDLTDIFSEEKTDVTLVSDVLATGYDFETENENGEGIDLYGRVWELESGIVEEGEDGNESIAREIKILRIYKENELNLLGVGDEARHYKNREELKMYGNVHIVSEDDSTTLDTETLIWREAKKEMSCPEPVELWIEDNHIFAEMMFSDKDMEKIDFLGRVSMHIVGIEKENFMTKEGYIDYEDVRQEGERDPDDVINVECEYMHYDKIEKRMECYPYIPHFIRKNYHFYLKRDEFKSAVPFRYQGVDTLKENVPELEDAGKSECVTEIEEAIIEDENPVDAVESDVQDEIVESLEEDKSDEENPPLEESTEEKSERRIASPDPEPFPGMFPDRLIRQVYCWKQNKKIYSNHLDINLKKKLLKPRFDVYIWAFDMNKEIKKKHDKEGENPSKTAKAIAKETTEIFGDFMNVYWKKDFVDAWGGVEIRQKDKYFNSVNMVYTDEIGLMQADGDVYLNQIDGEWLEREGLLEDMTDEEAKEDAKKPTEIFSDGMISYDDRDYVYMIGNVHILQDDQNIISDEGEFSDKDDFMVLWGNVRYRSEDGERLNADKLTIYTEENRYIAEGTAWVRSLVPEKYEDDLEELEGDSEETKKDKPAIKKSEDLEPEEKEVDDTP